ncbi:hypothetical protein VWN23_08370, partial [Campylobacter coli]
EISNPLLVLEKAGYEGVLAYIQDKRDEIKDILCKLSSAITMGKNSYCREFRNRGWI